MSRCKERLAAMAGCAACLWLAACSSTSSNMGPATDASTVSGGPCSSAMFEDHSSASASRTVSFGGTGSSGPFSYSPQCMTIHVGQVVTFDGDFSVHPLAAGAAPGATTGSGSPDNPIPSMSSGEAPATVTFPSAGTYAYFCRHHYAAGMVGAVEVH